MKGPHTGPSHPLKCVSPHLLVLPALVLALYLPPLLLLLLLLLLLPPTPLPFSPGWHLGRQP